MRTEARLCTSQLVTVLSCTNATGSLIPPTTIFKGKTYKSKFADGFPNGSFVATADSGVINEDCFRTWLRHFQTHRVAVPCALLSDGPTSLKNLPALEFCEDNIQMVCLPGYTTYRLLPLDSL